MGTTISLEKALNAGIITLSKNQIKRCKGNDIVQVWYSNRACDPNPKLIDDTGDTVFNFVDGKLRVAK